MFSGFHKAELNFCKLAKPVADFPKVPEEETTWVDIRDWKAPLQAPGPPGLSPPHPGLSTPRLPAPENS
jgi:hypothetical protein